ncbi:pimeloyl-ACP methyl ester carboxylesterase [Loktanella ponticola]|uniref:Pimeloyl-ACP methyl ester carboxylesterase n=1 Tax=Yoonia ponticola TaxID=1524255 RepID=A0A7W9F179_9RHOB|nr:pimeloyl-ACP methyl ester carboxylesterase [Yoonia ponticola]
MKTNWRIFALGLVLLFVGSIAAHLVQTTNGVTIKDVRYIGANGNLQSGLLYMPEGVTAQAKAPAILAVHGYINTREVQSGFAIEYSRRGYVVLSIDQTGHGYSEGAAFSAGFGGPAALQYLRSLDIVDVDNIGMEGHSMGGWTVLAAAATYPDDYKSIVLEGSSVGAPFAAEGTADWPRNVSVVFSAYDEFSSLMWGVDKADDVEQSPKLMAFFSSETPVEEGKIYGDIAAGNARILWQPPVTHPGDHLSRAAIGHSVSWFAQTLDGARPLPADNQIWFYKEFATLIGLVGFVVLILGTLNGLLSLPWLRDLQATPVDAAHTTRDAKWWGIFLFSALFPVANYYPLFNLAETLFPASALLSQTITSQVAFWAVINGATAGLVGLLIRTQPVAFPINVARSLVLAGAAVFVAYLSTVIVDFFLKVDFRFWFVGVKLLTAERFMTALVYLVPFTIYFVLAMRALHGGLSVAGQSLRATYTLNALALMGGFLVFLILQYAALFSNGILLTPSEPLNTIVMFQFVPLLLTAVIISTFLYQRTSSYLPGAFVNALLVTWFVVAGQAAQFAAG